MKRQRYGKKQTRGGEVLRHRRTRTATGKLIWALAILIGGWWCVSFIRGRTIRGEPWDRWPDPESAGFSRAGLDGVRSLARELGTTALVVIVDGKLLLEHGDIKARGYMAGGRYSVAAMAFGRYLADGTIDLNRTLEELGIDDREGLLPTEKRATVEQILTCRSGVYHPSNFGANSEDTPPRGSVEPGTRFHYHPWGGVVTKTLFELLTGRDLFQAIGEDLAAPLGLQDFKWWRQNPGHDRKRSNFTIWNLYVSTRDAARFGQLMLQRGEWKGEQLIPRGWVDRMTSVVTSAQAESGDADSESELGFGYQWWVWDKPDHEGPFEGAYTYRGSYGQYLTVLPVLKMVVAHQVFAGWFGAPERSVTWEQYRGLLDRLVAARILNNPPDQARSSTRNEPPWTGDQPEHRLPAVAAVH
jgi:hypothetical protein